MYVSFKDTERFNEVMASIDLRDEKEIQVRTSVSYLREQIEEKVDAGEEIPAEIQAVVRAIDANNFGGNIWFFI